MQKKQYPNPHCIRIVLLANLVRRIRNQIDDAIDRIDDDGWETACQAWKPGLTAWRTNSRREGPGLPSRSPPFADTSLD